MTGHLNMTFKDTGNEMESRVECSVQRVSRTDKFIAVHLLLKALQFTEAEKDVLCMAISMDIWPDTVEEAQER